MEHTNRINLLPVLKNPDIPCSEIIIDGRGTSAIIDGIVLAVALQVSGGFLIFTTDDCPYEEGLHIYFLDHAARVRDHAHTGGLYTTGNFSNLCLLNDNELSFQFFAGGAYTLTLLSHPVWCLPLIGDARGVTRSKSFRRYFRLRFSADNPCK